MALARDAFMARSVPDPSLGLADARTSSRQVRQALWKSRTRRGSERVQRATYPDLSWGQVAASVLAGIACATAVSESKGKRPSDRDRGLEEPSWREFRARLVQQEKGVHEELPDEDVGWMHSAQLIEKGSVLISRSGDHFTLDQQYFLHSVILILKRDEGGDVGVILNRPSECSVEDLGVPKLNAFEKAEFQLRKLLSGRGLLGSVEEQPWKVSYGGPMHSARDAEQEQPTLLCLYRCDREGSDAGEEIIRGLHWLPFSRAREMVATGAARQEDFLVLSGYCGWRPGQLQEELDSGRSWLLAAADRQAVFGGRPLRSSTSDLGISQWERLHEKLFDLASSVEGHDAKTAEAALKRWMMDLKKEQMNPALKGNSPTLRSLHPTITAGRLLRGSASAWTLGGPAGLRPAKPSSASQPPAQYLHKAVLLALADVTPDQPSVALPCLKSVRFSSVLPGEDLAVSRQLLHPRYWSF